MIMEELPLKLDNSETHCDEQINASVNSITSSATNCDVPQLPVKKPTRQWAAWTRQEEESFFTSLRQVGKNFEKITRRVQSKNKDQVRHYYYRLVRRMNKLLGPELCLNSKNSKDTNAAMLRWWSLLEKYSCKASKLHLKPRRFKLFVEALEAQLIKDRKKNTRKREIPFPLSPNSGTYYDRQAPNDQSMVKLVFVDSQNVDKLGSGKGLVSRNLNISPSVVTKGESSSLKPIRQRRKQGTASSVAYKRWEKAAIAGMSLVADAAEHLERTAKNSDSHKGLPENHEGSVQVPRACSNLKLKLQLFPFDETTRRTLEMDKHNPFLELTLSSKKKISSVIEHLNKKWGKSGLENRKLFLFPYCAEGENTFGRQYWTLNSSASAADAYAAVGSPSIFTLRYGWFSENEFNQNALEDSQVPTNNEHDISHKDGTLKSSSSLDITFNLTENVFCNVECSGPEKRFKADGVRPNTDPISNVEWGESLTNISIGDLLLDDPPMDNTFASEVYQTSFTCDSFDTAIAAHLLKHQKPPFPSSDPPSFSLWDAEETCDAFAFQNTNTVHPHTTPSNIESNTPFLEQPVIVPQEVKTSTGLTDMYWPESLGPLDELPSCKYQETELILSDSFSGLNRLIANSLDAFQSINFLSGQEKIVSNT